MHDLSEDKSEGTDVEEQFSPVSKHSPKPSLDLPLDSAPKHTFSFNDTPPETVSPNKIVDDISPVENQKLNVKDIPVGRSPSDFFQEDLEGEEEAEAEMCEEAREAGVPFTQDIYTEAKNDTEQVKEIETAHMPFSKEIYTESKNDKEQLKAIETAESLLMHSSDGFEQLENTEIDSTDGECPEEEQQLDSSMEYNETGGQQLEETFAGFDNYAFNEEDATQTKSVKTLITTDRMSVESVGSGISSEELEEKPEASDFIDGIPESSEQEIFQEYYSEEKESSHEVKSTVHVQQSFDDEVIVVKTLQEHDEFSSTVTSEQITHETTVKTTEETEAIFQEEKYREDIFMETKQESLSTTLMQETVVEEHTELASETAEPDTIEASPEEDQSEEEEEESSSSSSSENEVFDEKSGKFVRIPWEIAHQYKRQFSDSLSDQEKKSPLRKPTKSIDMGDFYLRDKTTDKTSNLLNGSSEETSEEPSPNSKHNKQQKVRFAFSIEESTHYYESEEAYVARIESQEEDSTEEEELDETQPEPHDGITETHEQTVITNILENRQKELDERLEQENQQQEFGAIGGYPKIEDDMYESEDDKPYSSSENLASTDLTKEEKRLSFMSDISDTASSDTYMTCHSSSRETLTSPDIAKQERYLSDTSSDIYLSAHSSSVETLTDAKHDHYYSAGSGMSDTSSDMYLSARSSSAETLSPERYTSDQSDTSDTYSTAHSSVETLTSPDIPKEHKTLSRLFNMSDGSADDPNASRLLSGDDLFARDDLTTDTNLTPVAENSFMETEFENIISRESREAHEEMLQENSDENDRSMSPSADSQESQDKSSSTSSSLKFPMALPYVGKALADNEIYESSETGDTTEEKLSPIEETPQDDFPDFTEEENAKNSTTPEKKVSFQSEPDTQHLNSISSDDLIKTSTSSTEMEPTILAASYDLDSGCVSKVVATYDMSPDTVEKQFPPATTTKSILASPDDDVFEDDGEDGDESVKQFLDVSSAAHKDSSREVRTSSTGSCPSPPAPTPKDPALCVHETMPDLEGAAIRLQDEADEQATAEQIDDEGAAQATFIDDLVDLSKEGDESPFEVMSPSELDGYDQYAEEMRTAEMMKSFESMTTSSSSFAEMKTADYEMRTQSEHLSTEHNFDMLMNLNTSPLQPSAPPATDMKSESSFEHSSPVSSEPSDKGPTSPFDMMSVSYTGELLPDLVQSSTNLEYEMPSPPYQEENKLTNGPTEVEFNPNIDFPEGESLVVTTQDDSVIVESQPDLVTSSSPTETQAIVQEEQPQAQEPLMYDSNTAMTHSQMEDVHPPLSDQLLSSDQTMYGLDMPSEEAGLMSTSISQMESSGKFDTESDSIFGITSHEDASEQSEQQSETKDNLIEETQTKASFTTEIEIPPDEPINFIQQDVQQPDDVSPGRSALEIIDIPVDEPQVPEQDELFSVDDQTLDNILLKSPQHTVNEGMDAYLMEEETTQSQFMKEEYEETMYKKEKVSTIEPNDDENILIDYSTTPKPDSDTMTLDLMEKSTDELSDTFDLKVDNVDLGRPVSPTPIDAHQELFHFDNDFINEKTQEETRHEEYQTTDMNNAANEFVDNVLNEAQAHITVDDIEETNEPENKMTETITESIDTYSDIENIEFEMKSGRREKMLMKQISEDIPAITLTEHLHSEEEDSDKERDHQDSKREVAEDICLVDGRFSETIPSEHQKQPITTECIPEEEEDEEFLVEERFDKIQSSTVMSSALISEDFVDKCLPEEDALEDENHDEIIPKSSNRPLMISSKNSSLDLVDSPVAEAKHEPSPAMQDLVNLEQEILKPSELYQYGSDHDSLDEQYEDSIDDKDEVKDELDTDVIPDITRQTPEKTEVEKSEVDSKDEALTSSEPFLDKSDSVEKTEVDSKDEALTSSEPFLDKSDSVTASVIPAQPKEEKKISALSLALGGGSPKHVGKVESASESQNLQKRRSYNSSESSDDAKRRSYCSSESSDDSSHRHSYLDYDDQGDSSSVDSFQTVVNVNEDEIEKQQEEDRLDDFASMTSSYHSDIMSVDTDVDVAKDLDGPLIDWGMESMFKSGDTKEAKTPQADKPLSEPILPTYSTDVTKTPKTQQQQPKTSDMSATMPIAISSMSRASHSSKKSTPEDKLTPEMKYIKEEREDEDMEGPLIDWGQREEESSESGSDRYEYLDKQALSVITELSEEDRFEMIEKGDLESLASLASSMSDRHYSSPDMPLPSPGLGGIKMLSRSADRDDASISSSLVEFERLEREIGQSASRSSLEGKESLSSSVEGPYIYSKSVERDDISVTSSLAEFEKLERDLGHTSSSGSVDKITPPESSSDMGGSKSSLDISGSKSSLNEFERLETDFENDRRGSLESFSRRSETSSIASLNEFERLEREMALTQELEIEAQKILSMLQTQSMTTQTTQGYQKAFISTTTDDIDRDSIDDKDELDDSLTEGKKANKEDRDDVDSLDGDVSELTSMTSSVILAHKDTPDDDGIMKISSDSLGEQLGLKPRDPANYDNDSLLGMDGIMERSSDSLELNKKSSESDSLYGQADIMQTSADSLHGQPDIMQTSMDSLSGVQDIMQTSLDSISGHEELMQTSSDSITSREHIMQSSIDSLESFEKLKGKDSALSMDSSVWSISSSNFSKSSQDTMRSVGSRSDSSDIMQVSSESFKDKGKKYIMDNYHSYRTTGQGAQPFFDYQNNQSELTSFRIDDNYSYQYDSDDDTSTQINKPFLGQGPYEEKKKVYTMAEWEAMKEEKRRASIAKAEAEKSDEEEEDSLQESAPGTKSSTKSSNIPIASNKSSTETHSTMSSDLYTSKSETKQILETLHEKQTAHEKHDFTSDSNTHQFSETKVQSHEKFSDSNTHQFTETKVQSHEKSTSNTMSHSSSHTSQSKVISSLSAALRGDTTKSMGATNKGIHGNTACNIEPMLGSASGVHVVSSA